MINSMLPKEYHKPLRVLGIDLGTTNSVMTQIKWQAGNKPEINVLKIKQDTPLGEYSDMLFPSVVAIHQGKTWIGEGANRLKKNPQRYKLKQYRNLFYETKLDMGIGKTYAQAPEGYKNASEIAGHIIRKMIEHAMSIDSSPIDHVMVTVPASFQVAQRRDTLRAAELAGIEINGSNLLDEPIAALIDFINSIEFIDYLPSLNENSNIMVIDFGGGTCDVAIARFIQDNKNQSFSLFPMAVSRYYELGGIDIDLAIVYDILIQSFCAENGIDEINLGYSEKKIILEPQLLPIAENLKIMMSNDVRKRMELKEYSFFKKDFEVCLSNTFEIEMSCGKYLFSQPSLSFKSFNRIMQSFLCIIGSYDKGIEYRNNGSIFAPIKDALKHSSLEREEIDVMLLTGGSCLLPHVESRLRSYFKEASIFSTYASISDLAGASRGAAFNALYHKIFGKSIIESVCHQQISIITSQGMIPLVPAGARLPFPYKSIWKKPYGYTLHGELTFQSKEIRIKVVAEKEYGSGQLYTTTWNLMPFMNNGESVVLLYNMNEDKVLDIRLSLKNQKLTSFIPTIENPISQIANLRNYQREIMEYEEIVRRSYNSPMLLNHLKHMAHLYAKYYKYEKAIDLYKRYFEDKSEPDVSVLNQLGVWYGCIKNYETQEKYFLEASKDNNWFAPLYNLALSFFFREKYDNAIKYLNQALERDDDPAIYALLYGSYLRAGNIEKQNEYLGLSLRKLDAFQIEDLKDYHLFLYKSIASAANRNELAKELRDCYATRNPDDSYLSSLSKDRTSFMLIKSVAL